MESIRILPVGPSRRLTKLHLPPTPMFVGSSGFHFVTGLTHNRGGVGEPDVPRLDALRRVRDTLVVTHFKAALYLAVELPRYIVDAIL